MRMRARKRAMRLVLAVAGVLFFSHLSAGGNSWTATGLEGGKVRSIAVHPWNPEIVYAGTDDAGIYRSDDGGETWEYSSHGFGRSMVWSIVINPSNPTKMFALRWGRGGVFASDDGGRRWRALAIGEDHDIRRMTFVPDPFTLYLPIDGKIAFSSDNGETWSETSDRPSGSGGYFAVNPLDRGNIISVGRDGAFASDDGGGTWRQCGTELGSGLHRVAFDPFDPGVVLVPKTDELFRSEDGCKSWTRFNHPDLHGWGFLQGDAFRADTFYAGTLNGMLRSADGGATWAPFGPTGEPLRTHAIVQPQRNPDVMFFAAEAADARRGVFRSSDGGDTWTIGMAGLNVATVQSLIADPINPEVLYAGTRWSGLRFGHGVYTSTDAGSTWNFLSGTEDAGPIVVLDPTEPEILYAITNDWEILKTVDSGRSWTEVWSGFDGEEILDLAVDPSSPGVLYSATPYPRSAHRSDDGGHTWSDLTMPDSTEVYSIFPDPRTPGTVYANTFLGLFVSKDRGESWSSSSSGLETPEGCRNWGCGDYHDVSEMLFHPTDPNVMYAATWIGPFRTSDGGDTWELAREGFLICCAIDGSWSDECDDLTKSATTDPIMCEGGPGGMVLDRDDPDVLYATTAFGTYRSRNGGDNWERLSQDSTGFEIVSIGDNVLLGTSYNAGVVRFEVEDPLAPRRGRRRVGGSP